MPINKLNSKSENNKKLFAGYLNMARNNAYVTISHISKILGFNSVVQENNLHKCELIQMLNNTRGYKSEIVNKAIIQLDKNFPFLKPMLDKELQFNLKENEHSSVQIAPKSYYKILSLVFRTLNAYRNEYTHYEPVDSWSDELISQQKVLVGFLRNCFDGARRQVKDRFSFSNSDMEFLTGNEHFQRVPMLDNNGKPLKNKKGFTQMKFTERDDFYFLLHSKDNDKNTRLSSVGLVMFIALFIHKQYTKILIDKCGFFNGRYSTDNEKKIIFEIFCLYRQKLIKERLKSSKDSTALSLDILNELQKCPIELFNTLSPKKQAEFRIINDEGNENLLVRFDDRFPRLAMQYIDEQNVFDSIRFQVSLGKYRYKFYNKQCIDSTEADRVRSLQKDINGFGKLHEIELARQHKYADFIRDTNNSIEDTADTKPYITNQYAQYMITANRIGLIFNREDRSVLRNNLFLPDLDGKNTHCESPECWLSIYEIPQLIFLHLLTKDDDSNCVESLIKDCVHKYRTFFSDIASGKLNPVGIVNYNSTISKYGLEPNDIPQEIQDFLKGKKEDIQELWYEVAEDHYINELEYSERLLERFNDNLKLAGTKDNKIGKKRFINIKPGKLAAWLASDIVKLQPTLNNGKDKLTGLNFSVMQAALATYSGDISNLKRIFTNAALIGGSHPHPFLEKVVNKSPQDTISFYKYYLEFRKTYFDEVRVSNSRPNQERWKNRDDKWYRRLASRYLNSPIELPRGLFETRIKDELSHIKAMKQALTKQRCNITYLIGEYFDKVRGDKNQPFYYTNNDYKRTYKYFNVLNNKKICNSLQELFLSTDEMIARIKNESLIYTYIKSIKNKEKESELIRLRRLKNEYSDNEKNIRRYKVQDILLFMMAYDSIMSQLMDPKEKNVFRLCEIHPTNDFNILSKQVTFQIKVKNRNKEILIKQDNLKIKNYGDFFHFLYDPRVIALLPHITSSVVDRNELERELDNYERVRPEIFGFALTLEKQIIEKSPNRLKGITINPNSTLAIKNSFSALIRRGHILSQDNENTIIEIRNAFCHNSYPQNMNSNKLPEIAKSCENAMKDIINNDF